MKHLILVDACNLIHRLPAYRNRLGDGIDLLAQQLLQQIRCLHDLLHWEIHLVVDGKGSRIDQQFIDRNKTLSIVFAPRGQSADTVIETWLLRLDPGWSVKVATEDRAVAHTAIAQGAEILSPQQLLDWADRTGERFSRSNQKEVTKSDSKFGNKLEGLS